MVWYASLSAIFRSFKSAPIWLSTRTHGHWSPRNSLQHFGSHNVTHGCSTNSILFVYSGQPSRIASLSRFSVGLFQSQERMSVYSLLNSNESTSRNRNRDGRITINSLLSRPGEERNKVTSSSAVDRTTASLDYRSSMINRHTSMYVARNNNTTRTALPSIASLRQSFHENNPATRTGQSRNDRLSSRNVLAQVSHTPKSNRSNFNTKPYDGPELHKVGRTISVPHNNFGSSAAASLTESPGDSTSPTIPNSASHVGLTLDQGSTRQVTNPPRRRWKEWEDEKLTRLVNDMGPHHWNSIAEHFPGRNGRQVRLRWMNHLQPSLDKRPWREDEDSVLLAAHAELGNKWALIAMRLNGRTDNSVKNRYKSITRKASRASAPTTGISRWRRLTRINFFHSPSEGMKIFCWQHTQSTFYHLLGLLRRHIRMRVE